MADLEPLHPSGRRLSDFERALWRLKMVSHEMTLLHCAALLPEDRKQDSGLLFTLTNYGLILICKFLEIWDGFNGMGRSNRRIREVTHAVSPAVRRITKTWPNIRQYRNWALAHPYSVNESPEITPPWRLLEAGVAPNRSVEIIVLMDAARFAAAGVLAYFSDFYRSMGPTFALDGEEMPAHRGLDSGEEGERERRSIADEVNDRLAAIGVDLGDPVFKEMQCRPPVAQENPPESDGAV